MCALMTRRRTPGLLAACLLLSLPAAVLEAQQPFYGPRATGMAGAQTASVSDSTAILANPAGLGVDPKLDVDLFANGLASDRGNFTSSVNYLAGLDLGNLTPAQIAGAAASLATLAEPGAGVIGSGALGLTLSERGLGVSADVVAYAGVYPMVDLVHVKPGDDPATGIKYNTTGVNSIGLEAREIRVGYAYGLYGRTLLIGLTTRYIWGRTFYNHTPISDVTQDNIGSIIVDAMKENAKNTNAFTLDAGILLNVISTVKVGIVAASLTKPKFDVKQDPQNPTLVGAPAYVQLPLTVRAGASVTPISALTVAMDYDLVASDTLIPGGKSQQLSIGAEVNLPIVAIRGGGWTDFKAPNPHWSYAAGVGIKLTVVSINASVLLSPEGGLKFQSPEKLDVGAALDAHFRF